MFLRTSMKLWKKRERKAASNFHSHLQISGTWYAAFYGDQLFPDDMRSHNVGTLSQKHHKVSLFLLEEEETWLKNCNLFLLQMESDIRQQTFTSTFKTYSKMKLFNSMWELHCFPYFGDFSYALESLTL